MAGRAKMCIDHETRISKTEESMRWIKTGIKRHDRYFLLLFLSVAAGIGVDVTNHMGWW